MTSVFSLKVHESPFSNGYSVVAVLPVMYYSFLPMLYIIEPLKLDKLTIFSGLLLAAVASWFLRHYRSRVNSGKAITLILYLLFSVYSLLNFLTSEFADDMVSSIINITAVNSIAVFLALGSTDNKKAVFHTVLLLFLVYLAFAVYSIFTGYLNHDHSGVRNIFPGLGSADDSSYYQNICFYFGLGIVLIFGSEVWRRAIWVKVGAIALAIFSFYVMLLIGGRASIAASIVTVAIQIWISLRRQGSVQIVAVLFLSVLIVLSITFLLAGPGSDSEYWKDLPGVRRFIALAGEGDPSMRLVLFSQSISLFLHDVMNLIFGAGIGGFPVYIGTPGMYPHNLFLELLAEYGLVGLVLFMSPVIYVLSVRKKKLGSLTGFDTSEQMSFTLAIYVWLVAMVTGGIGASWILVFFTYLLYPNSSFAHYKVVSEPGTRCL